MAIDKKIVEVLPAVRMMLSDEKIKIAKIAEAGNAALAQIEVDATKAAEEVLGAVKAAADAYKAENGAYPQLINLKGLGLAAVAETATQLEELLEHGSCGDAFETHERAHGKTAIVTGGAQGFGGGVVEQFVHDGGNVIIADLNEALGKQFAEELNAKSGSNKAFFVKVDVSNLESVENLIYETVCEFGGFDVFISNAGVLRAGGLEEMDGPTFDFMTKVNYTGYFYCAKASSKVLKLQTAYKKGYYADIIQINSKSGLKGSNKNFAYAGGKFGGIGLTQSFAMELMPSRVKVNSICPGNFFDGPLWSDPEKGLFVQYLNAGKVKGAKTIEDVKAFYEAQVPAGRGCTVIDVMRAVYYIMEQEYETGQAVPVTGGQEMLR